MSGTLSPWPVVQNGSQGHPILTLQFLLCAHGHNLTVDGTFGPATEAAVKAFQTSKGMTADAIMSAQTWSAQIIQVKKKALATLFAVSRPHPPAAVSDCSKNRRLLSAKR